MGRERLVDVEHLAIFQERDVKSNRRRTKKLGEFLLRPAQCGVQFAPYRDIAHNGQLFAAIHSGNSHFDSQGLPPHAAQLFVQCEHSAGAQPFVDFQPTSGREVNHQVVDLGAQQGGPRAPDHGGKLVVYVQDAPLRADLDNAVAGALKKQAILAVAVTQAVIDKAEEDAGADKQKYGQQKAGAGDDNREGGWEKEIPRQQSREDRGP